MPELSVVLTSYNRPNLIRRSINSVLEQDFKDYELLIIDDNSTEGTLRSIDSFSDKRIIKLSSNLERGVNICRYSANINQALKTAKGKYITYLTDDDYYLPGRLNKMISSIDCTSGKHVVYSGQKRITLDDNSNETHSYISHATSIIDEAIHIVDHNSVLHCVHCVFEVGGWDEDQITSIRSDGMFWNRLTDAGYLFHPVDIIGEVKHIHNKGIQQRILRGENVNIIEYDCE